MAPQEECPECGSLDTDERPEWLVFECNECGVYFEPQTFDRKVAKKHGKQSKKMKKDQYYG